MNTAEVTFGTLFALGLTLLIGGWAWLWLLLVLLLLATMWERP